METNSLKTQVGGSHTMKKQIIYIAELTPDQDHTFSNIGNGAQTITLNPPLEVKAGDTYTITFYADGSIQKVEAAPTYAIDWSKVPKGYDFVAMDSDGEIWFYLNRPKRLSNVFFIGVDKCKKFGVNSKLHWFPPGTDWRETLTKRP